MFVIDIFTIIVIGIIVGGIGIFILLRIDKICFHKRSLLGMLDRETQKEQWYCSICRNVILKKWRNEPMKITKGQTALIVMGIAGVLGALVLINAIRLHPVIAILIGLAVVGVGVGYYMYRRNNGK